MDTPDQQPQEKEPKEERTRYVDELRSREDYPPGDGWISITDAARITRTSEAMARRWVTSGRLAVKKEAVGISKHTRLVRISDVAEIRPIVDPTAAITGDVQKLDLPSIPRQQQQIMADHERLLQENAHLTGIVEQFTARLQEALDQQALRLTTLDETHSRTLQALKIALAEMSADLERVRENLTNATEQRAAELRRMIEDEQHQRQQDTQESQTLLQQATAQMSAERESQGRKLEEMSTEVAQAKGTIGQVQRDLQQASKDLQAAIERAYQKATREATALLEQQARELTTQLENVERDQARDVATLTTQFESISTRLEQMNTAISTVKSTTESNLQRAMTQEKRLDALQHELEQEREARRALTQQLQQGQKAKGRRTEAAE